MSAVDRLSAALLVAFDLEDSVRSLFRDFLGEELLASSKQFFLKRGDTLFLDAEGLGGTLVNGFFRTMQMGTLFLATLGEEGLLLFQ